MDSASLNVPFSLTILSLCLAHKQDGHEAAKRVSVSQPMPLKTESIGSVC